MWQYASANQSIAAQFHWCCSKKLQIQKLGCFMWVFNPGSTDTYKIIQIKYIHSLSCSEVTVKLVVMMSQSYTNKICICLTLQMNIGHANIFFTSHLYLLDTGSPLHHSNVSVCAHTTSNYVNTLDQDWNLQIKSDVQWSQRKMNPPFQATNVRTVWCCQTVPIHHFKQRYSNIQL